jgi:hypothetical protein
MNRDLEHETTQLLAPLEDIPPADRGRGRPVLRRHKILGVALAIVLLAITLGATWAAINLTATPAKSPGSRGRALACLHLVGRSAGHAETVLSHQGYTVTWRLMRYLPPDGKQFTVSTVPRVPSSAIVENLAAAGGKSVIVFVHFAADHRAPAPPQPACPEE